MDNIDIMFAKVNKNAKIPTKKDEDAGYDIYACFDENMLEIKAHETKLIPTGIASALPKDYYFQIEERGSTGSKGIKKSAGVIDSGFRGEWFIAITNTNSFPVVIVKEEGIAEAAVTHKDALIYPYEKAIAQAVLHRVPRATVTEISYDELKRIKSERGTNMLGSSNK